MRPKLTLRSSRPVHMSAGALMLAIPASAVALSAGQADAQSAFAQSPVRVTLTPHQIAYGNDVTVTGAVASTDRGRGLLLEFAPAGGGRWRSVASTRVGRNGGFRLVAPLQRSGLVKVVGATGGSIARATLPGPTTTGATTTTATVVPVPVIAPSASHAVTVSAKLVVPTQSIDVLGGQTVGVRGHLLPRDAGRLVRLDGRSGGGWHTLAVAHTGSKGGFDLRYGTGNTGHEQLRVRFAGDRGNTAVSTRAGGVTVYRQSVASWYYDGGSTACGFHANFGVANKDLPCGTQVTFHHNGRSVTATVDDRGPYVGGREWDLNQNTAGALGLSGVDTVWSSI
jgi:rare lipoprotein A